MAEPLNALPLNKCSDSPRYLQHYLEKAADKVLADSDSMHFIKEAVSGNSFITLDGLFALSGKPVVKALRKRFTEILLSKLYAKLLPKIKNKKKRLEYKRNLTLIFKPKFVKTTKADIFVFTSPSIKMASEQLAIQQVISRVKQLAKRGRYASLRNIIKGGTKRLGSKLKLIECLAAIRAIGNTKYRAAGPWLIKVVQKGQDERLRRQAMVALGKMGDKRATPALIKVLTNWKELYLTKKMVIATLARIGDKRAIPALMKVAGRDLLGLAPIALAALAQMPEVILDHRASFRAMLVKLIKREDIQLRNTATMILAALGDRRAVPNLIKMLSQTNFNNIDLNPAKNISRLVKSDPSLVGGGKQAAPLVFQHVYNKFLTRYSKAKIPVVKMAIIGKLMKFRDKRSILPLIILAKREPGMRKPVLAALARIVNKDSLPVMLALLKHRDKVVRHFAVHFLGYVNDVRVIRPLVERLYDKDPKIEREAVRSLTRLSDLPTVRRSFFIKALAKKYSHKSTDSAVKQIILKAVRFIRSRGRNAVTASN